MPLVSTRPLTPGQRFLIRNRQENLHKGRPEKSLLIHKHFAKGRNCYGRITSRRRGGGHKRLLRQIDFRRSKLDVKAEVLRIEYDPNRSGNIALIRYADGDIRYILAPRGLEAGDTIFNTLKPQEEFPVGICIPLKNIPPATFIHCVELQPGKGAQIARAAGQQAQLVSIEGKVAAVKMPSGEVRQLHADCRAVIGRVGNVEHIDASLGKAGRNRWLGRRPRVRGMVMNPVDHPNGGGQGKSKGGGGRQQPVSPWGQLAKGFPTRRRSKPSNAQIVTRRNGRKLKK